MYRKLKFFFRRKRFFLSAIAISFILLFLFLLNEPLENSELQNRILDIEQRLQSKIGNVAIFKRAESHERMDHDSDGLVLDREDARSNKRKGKLNDVITEGDVDTKEKENIDTLKTLEVGLDDVKNKGKTSKVGNSPKESPKDAQKTKDNEKKENIPDRKDMDIIMMLRSDNKNEDQKKNGVDKKEIQKTVVRSEDNKNEGRREDNKDEDINSNDKNDNDDNKLQPVAVHRVLDDDFKKRKLPNTEKFFGNLTQSGLEARKAVMALLDKDKQTTYEVDLDDLNLDGSVTFPPFVNFGSPGDPGELGKPVSERTDSMTRKELKANKEQYAINQFNLGISNKISVHRTLKDTRRNACKNTNYDWLQLPPCSVVLVFNNEAWTTLLRSIHSIIDRTPKQALLEIVLLDDNSDQEHLKAPLEAYIKPLKIVRLVRATKRLGLIKARNLGFTYAKGEIIVFLDSHIECFPGWLEPLVAPIAKDPRMVTFPVIPNISKDSFGINSPLSSAVGNMRIHTMTFRWEHSEPEGKPYYDSPTMPGGLYAISREWFGHLGAYDPELLYWGGENLEISLKVWMCGGRIQVAACSYVGHVFRSTSPFHFDGFSKAIQRNLLRVADIWLDDFKHFYLEKFTYLFEAFGDTSLQRRLHQGLQCHNFRWYLDNVNTILKDEIDADGIYSGQVKNEGDGQCLLTGDKAKMLNVPYLAKCSMLHYRMVWQYRTTGFLSSYDKMMVTTKTVSKNGVTYTGLSMADISAGKVNYYAAFDYDQNHRLVERVTRQCLDTQLGSMPTKVVLAPCADTPNQRWSLQTRKELQEYHKKRHLPSIEW